MYLRCWVPFWLRTGHETPACNCRWSQDICNIFPTSSSFQAWDKIILVAITPCLVAKLKMLKPLRWRGLWHMVVAVVQLIPIFDKNIGKYLLWICLHCLIVKHVAPSGYCIMAHQINWKPMWVCSWPRGALLIHCLMVDACWRRYWNLSLSFPSGANQIPRVCMPFVSDIHWIVLIIHRQL